MAINGAYAVTVKTQPDGQTCVVTNGSGQASAPVNGVAVACTTNTYVLGGTVSGLSSGESVVLQNTVGDDTVTATTNGAFTFLAHVAYGASYAVVATPPAGKTCAVANASGTMTGAVSNLTVSCTLETYSLGGTVSGLASDRSVVLRNNGGDDLTVSANGPFTFPTAVVHGTAYAVTIRTQPVGQTCVLTSPSGTATGPVANLGVTCTVNTYFLGGSVSGLGAGDRLTLQDGLGGTLDIAANGPFTFPSLVAHGMTYAVVVSASPDGKTCQVTNGIGTLTAAVSNVSVACALKLYGLGGVVDGLGSGRSLVVQNNGTGDVRVSSNGAFFFSTPVAHGAVYEVTILEQPSGQACTVQNGAGVATADVSDVTIPCETLDAGTAPEDAGTEPDAGFPIDGGTEPDAGASVDAGETSDAGLEVDAGATIDAGTEADAGGLDAGTQADAGSVADAGTSATTDAGAPGVEPASCSCSGTGVSGAWLLHGLLAFGAVRGRRGFSRLSSRRLTG